MGTVTALFGVVLAAAMADLLLPGETGGGTQKYLHLLTALAVLLLILTPLFSLLREGVSLPQLPDTEEGTQEYYQSILDAAVNSEGEQKLRAGVAEAVAGKFEIKAECVRVELLPGSGEIQRLRVTLSGMGLLRNPDEIAAYLEELTGLEVEVR